MPECSAAKIASSECKAVSSSALTAPPGAWKLARRSFRRVRSLPNFGCSESTLQILEALVTTIRVFYIIVALLDESTSFLSVPAEFLRWHLKREELPYLGPNLTRLPDDAKISRTEYEGIPSVEKGTISGARPLFKFRSMVLSYLLDILVYGLALLGMLLPEGSQKPTFVSMTVLVAIMMLTSTSGLRNWHSSGDIRQGTETYWRQYERSLPSNRLQCAVVATATDSHSLVRRRT